MKTAEAGTVQGSPPLISGATRLVGIVGDPVGQVKSPANFNREFARRSIEAAMVPFHVHSARFESDIGALLALGNLDGLVVTMPFKARIMPVLGRVSEAAQQVGAVNAARRLASGEWYGDIFDGVGLVGAVRGLGFDPAGRRAGLVGAGGAGSAIAFALAREGLRSLAVVDQDHDRAADLARRLRDVGLAAEAVRELNPTGLDLLVNASPVGMEEGDAPPIDVDLLRPGTAVVDIVTRPGTRLLNAAREAGCPTAGGAQMVAAQTAAIIDFLDIRSGAARSGPQEPSEEMR